MSEVNFSPAETIERIMETIEQLHLCLILTVSVVCDFAISLSYSLFDSIMNCIQASR